MQATLIIQVSVVLEGACWIVWISTLECLTYFILYFKCLLTVSECWHRAPSCHTDSVSVMVLKHVACWWCGWLDIVLLSSAYIWLEQDVTTWRCVTSSHHFFLLRFLLFALLIALWMHVLGNRTAVKPQNRQCNAVFQLRMSQLGSQA